MIDLSLISVPILFVLSVITIVISNTFRAHYVKKENPSTSTAYILNGALSLVALVVLFAYAGFKLEFSTFTLITAIVFGIVTMIHLSFQTLALKFGPYSYTTVIISLSTIITALSGWAFWGEQLSLFKIIGLVFIVACFILAVDKKKDNKSANFIWFILCMVCLITSAGIGLTQKVHQSSDFRFELSGFLCLAFAISTIGSFVIGFILRVRENKVLRASGQKVKLNVKFLIVCSIICGITLALNNVLNLYLSGAVDSAIMFPIANGVPFVMAVVLSFVLFKEKLDKRQTIGIIAGVISMVLLCL